MKVTAFIRKTAAKNNVTDQARVYFRVRDVGGVDIKAASELSINPNHWSAERQGYKPRVALVSEEKRMGFEKEAEAAVRFMLSFSGGSSRVPSCPPMSYLWFRARSSRRTGLQADR